MTHPLCPYQPATLTEADQAALKAITEREGPPPVCYGDLTGTPLLIALPGDRGVDWWTSETPAWWVWPDDPRTAGRTTAEYVAFLETPEGVASW